MCIRDSSKPRVDDDSRVEALDAVLLLLFEEENKEEEEMMMMSEALTSEVLDASNSTLIRAKCFALLQRMNERSTANKSEKNEKKNNIIIIYEQMCVHPIREWMRILLDDESTTSNFSKEQLLKRVLFALDACGKINVFFEEEDEEEDLEEEKENEERVLFLSLIHI